MPLGENFAGAGALYVASDYTPVPLPDIPVNAMATKVDLATRDSFGGFCFQPPSLLLALLLNIPSSSGTPPSTFPPQTTIPTTPTTVPPAGGGGGGGTGTQPFSAPVNYLRNRAAVNGIPNGGCLGTGPTSGLASLVDCTSPNKALTFVANTGGFQIRQTNNGATCLQMGGAITGTEFDGAAGRTALVAQWGDCNTTTIQGGQTFASFFNYGLINNTGGIAPAWYYVIPRDNYPGWNNPCLSINGLITNPTAPPEQQYVQLSSTPVIQFTCQDATRVYWGQWAPAESFVNTGGCGSTCPPGPSGATYLEEIKPTLLEAAGDLACIGGAATPALFAAGSSECITFLPDIAPSTTQGGRSPWYLVDSSNPERCLGWAGTSTTWGLCDASAVWLDFESPTALAFSLRPQSNINLCVSRQVALEACANVSGQLWYDSGSISNLLKVMPTQPDSSWDSRTLDVWNAVEAEFPAMSTAMTVYRFQAPSAQRGQKQLTLPIAAADNVVQLLLREVMKYCDPRTRNCIGAVFSILNFAHWVVQGDVATKVGGKRECYVGTTLRRFDVVSGTCAAPIQAVEVKFDSTWGRTRGQEQLNQYVRDAFATKQQIVTVGASPPFPSFGSVSVFGYSTISYELLSTGVVVYKFNPRTLVPILFGSLGLQTYREYARKVFPNHNFQPARNGSIISSFIAAAKAAGEAPQVIGEQLYLQFTDQELDGWMQQQWRSMNPKIRRSL